MEIKPDIPKCEINGTEHSNCAENKALHYTLQNATLLNFIDEWIN